MGLNNTKSGSDHHAAKLNPSKVRAIRKLFHSGWKPNCIANAYGLSYNTVYDVITYVTWKEVR